ncbi:hypothetical protein [Bacillus sp. V5-8f]|uniref:hypothetical protein n=1 Tax=Bacillus sp. V5-8f TaxID=2053044 RepID=UPI000C774E77|nr:hypothetical protein [Bacillus sp. V5-8f]PLT34847.1 hypothetical protein CUU64_05435 [Bacillus sp. V5-8f]
MLQKGTQLIIGTLCGYLYIKWMDLSSPFRLAEFCAGLIMDPIKFLAATVAFIVGFINLSGIMKSVAEHVFQVKHHISMNKMNWIIVSLIVVSFFVLSWMSMALTIIFFIFAGVYGIISIKIPGNDKRG